VTLPLALLLPGLLFAAADEAGRAPSQQPPTFAVGVEGVYVDVFVTDHKRAVTGLAAADFELRVDGVRRPAELAGVDSQPLSTLLALDTSGSVAGEKLRALQAASRLVVERLRGDPVGLLTFDHEIRLRVPPTEAAEAVERALAGLQPGGATALYDAVYAATLLAPPGGRSLVVLFTDGEDNLSWLDRRELQPVLDSSNVILQAVGIVPDPRVEPRHTRELRQLAESTGGRFWAASAPERLAAAFGAMLDAMKTRYVLRFEPDVAQRPGLHTLEVKLVRRGGTVHCRRSYLAGPAGGATGPAALPRGPGGR
jgi:VWFA-related protein